VPREPNEGARPDVGQRVFTVGIDPKDTFGYRLREEVAAVVFNTHAHADVVRAPAPANPLEGGGVTSPLPGLRARPLH
jgi:hypothetical protein